MVELLVWLIARLHLLVYAFFLLSRFHKGGFGLLLDLGAWNLRVLKLWPLAADPAPFDLTIRPGDPVAVAFILRQWRRREQMDKWRPGDEDVV